MKKGFVETLLLRNASLWKAQEAIRIPATFQLELTARCNNNCRHCYINLPAQDAAARRRELSFKQIQDIACQALSLGGLWCQLTGGEPLLRPDFSDIYHYLKEKGFLVSVFTNATLIKPKHIALFKKYPPRDIEITVYGADRPTYERVTRTPGSFAAFMRGLRLLRKSGIKVRLKAMALRSNLRAFPGIARFCRAQTKDYFRFDPRLHMRFDGDQARNKEIESERLKPEEIVALESRDPERMRALLADCAKILNDRGAFRRSRYLFCCSAGVGGFVVSYDGFFKLCPCLCRPDCTYDLRKGTLEYAYYHFTPVVRRMRSQRPAFVKKCGACAIREFCRQCPAMADLETGALDSLVDYFCQVAHARSKAHLPKLFKKI